jgi:hypothetical protein
MISGSERLRNPMATKIIQRTIHTAPPKARLSPFAWYSRKLDTHPLTTKSISAFIVTGFGNVMSQALANDKNEEASDNKKSTIDWNRAGRFALLNAVVSAPTFHFWYDFLSKAVPGTTVLAVAKRVFWDEFVFSPGFLPMFVSCIWIVEGTPVQKIPTMIYEEVPSILLAEWALWIPTMAFTFRYIPVKFQVLMINSVGVFWYAFLSYSTKNAHTKHDSDGAESKVVSTEKPGSETRSMDHHSTNISAITTTSIP